MKYLALMAVFILNGCSSSVGVFGTTGHLDACINGVLYCVFNGGGVVVAYNKNGTVVNCVGK